MGKMDISPLETTFDLFRKSFGPKGYGYGGGAGTLSMDVGTITKPERTTAPLKKAEVVYAPSKVNVKPRVAFLNILNIHII